MFIPNVIPKYLKFHNLPTFQTMYQLGHDLFMMWYHHWPLKIHNKNRNVAHQATISL